MSVSNATWLCGIGVSQCVRSYSDVGYVCIADVLYMYTIIEFLKDLVNRSNLFGEIIWATRQDKASENCLNSRSPVVLREIPLAILIDGVYLRGVTPNH